MTGALGKQTSQQSLSSWSLTVLPARLWGEVSSMDMSPCGSSEESCLFGHGDCLGSGLGEAVADGCSSAWSVLAKGLDQSDEGNCPNRM